MVEGSHTGGLEAQVQALSDQVEQVRAEMAALREMVSTALPRPGGTAPSVRQGNADEMARSVSEAVGRATNRKHRLRGNVS